MAGFGIGTNTKQPDAGIVKGTLYDIACECWFTSSGKVTPLMLKLRDEDGEIRTIRQIIIHSSEEKNYAGIPSEEFDCTLIVLGKKIDVKLVFFMNEKKWNLIYK